MEKTSAVPEGRLQDMEDLKIEANRTPYQEKCQARLKPHRDASLTAPPQVPVSEQHLPLLPNPSPPPNISYSE